MTRMPSLLRPALRLLLGSLLAVAVACTWAATAEAGVNVTIQPPGGSNSASISTDDVTSDIPDKAYRVRSGSGTKEVKVTDGVSLLALLEETNTNFGYATIAIPRPSGPPLELTKQQVKDPLAQPVFFADEQGGMHFIWPTRDNSAISAQNYFSVGAFISLTQQAESRLKVEINPSSKEIKPGGTLTFKATATGDEPGETVIYSWWLAGKTPRRGTDEHVQDFPEKDGVYRVFVSAKIDGSGISATDYAKITVGDPKKAGEEQTGSGDQSTGSESGSGTGSGTGSSPTYTPSYTPTPTPTPAPTPPAIPPPDPVEPPDITTSGTPVTGNLLADASDPPPSSILESAAQAAREGKQDDGADSGGADVPEAALSIAGVLALLGLGAGIENRQGRRLSRPRLRMPKLALPRRGA